MTKSLQRAAFENAFYLRMANWRFLGTGMIYLPLFGAVYSIIQLSKIIEEKPAFKRRALEASRLKNLPKLPALVDETYKAMVFRYSIGSVPILGRIFIPLLDLTGSLIHRFP